MLRVFFDNLKRPLHISCLLFKSGGRNKARLDDTRLKLEAAAAADVGIRRPRALMNAKIYNIHSETRHIPFARARIYEVFSCISTNLSDSCILPAVKLNHCGFESSKVKM